MGHMLEHIMALCVPPDLREALAAILEERDGAIQKAADLGGQVAEQRATIDSQAALLATLRAQLADAIDDATVRGIQRQGEREAAANELKEWKEIAAGRAEKNSRLKEELRQAKREASENFALFTTEQKAAQALRNRIAHLERKLKENDQLLPGCEGPGDLSAPRTDEGGRVVPIPAAGSPGATSLYELPVLRSGLSGSGRLDGPSDAVPNDGR